MFWQNLRAEGFGGLIAACGVPPSLATSNSDGSSARRKSFGGFRRVSSVRPKARELKFLASYQRS